MLLQFPKTHHVRASAGSPRTSSGDRAAQSVIIWADTPAWPARSVAKIGDHQSAGMLLRCHHFETAHTPAPSSDAMLSRDGQSSITARNEVNSDMAAILGPIVLKGKDILSCDCEHPLSHNADMERMSETEERLAFVRRVRTARMARFDTQKPMITILGLDQGTYKQYETRTPLPHRFIPKFCAATGVEIDWLLTGEGEGPRALEPMPVPRKPRTKRTGRQRAA